MNHTEIEIASRGEFAAGKPYGQAGAYEVLSGRVRFAFDPQEPALSDITDIGFAPRDADGMLRLRADFYILKPRELQGGNGRLLFEWCNRGNKLALQVFNDAPASNTPSTAADAGNGFLFRRGYTLAWLAWQGDLWPGDGRMLIDLPVARGPREPITGRARREFIVESHGTTSLPLSGQIAAMPYCAHSLDNSQATLTRRRYPQDERVPVPRCLWRFAREERSRPLDPRDAETAIVPCSTHIHLDGGFEPGWIYELVYIARDPRVLGLGPVAVREFLCFLRRQADTARNPLAGSIRKVYGWGHSQSARAIREFLYCGLNEGADGARVCDGMLVHAPGAGRLWLNHRFANGSSTAGQQYEDHFNIADRFPFSYAACTDHLTGATDAILKRARTDPLVMHMQTASEYWQRHASLVHTDTQGNDLAQPDTVRIYHFSGSQHFAPAMGRPAGAGVCQLPANSMANGFFVRAILEALDAWATSGKPPPASCMPRRANHSLVSCQDWQRQFPAIPGCAIPSEANALALLDFGPNAARGLLDKEPPDVLDVKGYAVLVPAVDPDGNEIAGLRAPPVAVPVATYTGWNLRGEGQGKGAMYRFSGGMIPFAASASARSMAGDPRPSLAERYGGDAEYRSQLLRAARELYDRGFLLQEDLQRLQAAIGGQGLAPRMQ